MVLVIFILLACPVLGATVEKQVFEELKEKKEVPVIVELKDDALTSAKNLEKRKEAIKDKQEEVFEDLNLEEKGNLKTLGEKKDFELEYTYSTINGFSGEVTKEGLEKLMADPNVKKITYDYPIKLLLADSANLINANDVWNLSVSGHNITGAGETICVIDTGVDYTHPALGGCTSSSFLAGNCSKVISGYDYGNDDNNPVDVNSHGTHVAGIIASEDATYRGVAPGAKLVALKVFSDGGSGTTSNALSAIDWCVNNASKFNISVITMSIGVTDTNLNEIPYLGYCDANDTLAAKSSWAASQGIFVDVSAGNNKGTAGITAPACGENVTSVSSVTKTDAISGYNTAPILSLLAPGSSITSAVLNPNFGSKSGTSMAAPHVAGAAALFIDYWKKAYNATPTPSQIRNKLRLTGQNINDTRNSLVFPRIDILKALQPFINFTSSNPANASTIASTSVLINLTSDVSLSLTLLEWTYPNGTITNYTMASSNQTSFYYSLANLPLGNHSYQTYGNDSANTFGLSEKRTIITDQTPPVITINFPLNNSFHKESFNLSITITDLVLSSSSYNLTNASGNLLQTNFSYSLSSSSFNWLDLLNLSNSTFPDGNYSLTVFANDSLSNFAVKTAYFTLDKTKPYLFGFNYSPAAPHSNNTIIFYLNVTDEYLNSSLILIEGNWTGNFTNYTMSLETVGRFNYSLSPTNLYNQKHLGYRFYAVDLAGNFNSSFLFNLIIQNQKVNFLNITSPLSGTVSEVGDFIQFNALAADPDGDSLSYLWNFGDSTASSQQNPSKKFEATGTFVVILNVSDPYSISNLTNITLIINDTKPPNLISLDYDSQRHLQQEGSSLTVTATASDYSGLSSFILYFNGSLQSRSCSAQNNTAWSCSWSLANLVLGDHSFIINATDNFTIAHSNSSNYSFKVVSCSDGSQNGNEAGVDCGGSCPNACSSGGSTSGGGGGGGSSSGQPASQSSASQEAKKTGATSSGAKEEIKTLEAENTYFAVISTSEKTGRFKIEKEDIALSEIVILTKEEKKDIEIEIKSLEKPADLPKLDNAYQYLEVKISNLEKNELEEGTITFKVNKGWILENNYQEITLNVLSGNRWQGSSAALVSEDDKFNFYQAKVKEFNYLAITGKNTEVAETNEEESGLVGKAFAFFQTIKKLGAKSKALLILSSCVILLLVAYLIIRKKGE